MSRSKSIKAVAFVLLCCISIAVCSQANKLSYENEHVMQITHNNEGHTIHNTQCFSPDDQWIVFDTRNDETLIKITGTISMVNTVTGKVVDLYHTPHQNAYGPGVGAATFSPVQNRVLFIQGILNSNKNHPYGFTRRTGVAIDIDNPFHPIFMDARDIVPPFTPGALRGGTHAHTWSGDGKWVSFTYNDYIMEQLGNKDTAVKDLRTVGVMFEGKPVHVPHDQSGENNDGEMFSAVAAKVVENSAPGSDEIDKAFDEGWIGTKGYAKSDGSWQHRAIAFQGEVTNVDGTKKTEVFVLNIPDQLVQSDSAHPLEGTTWSRPNVPAGVTQKRITHTENGIQGPRHWLRSTPDGKLIAFLSKDIKGVIQVFGVSPNGGAIQQLTFNDYSIQGPFNFSPDGEQLAYPANNTIYITNIKTEKTKQVTPRYPDEEKLAGSVVWSNNGSLLAFNKFVKDNKTGKFFSQIFLVKADLP